MGGLKKRYRNAILCGAVIGLLAGCVSAPAKLEIKEISERYPADTIISGDSGKPISFDQLIQDLASVQIIYVGESHTDPAHHAIQLKIIEAILDKHPDVAVGMEMFAQPYQPVLDMWTDGGLETQNFLEKVHWYATWRYDFDLYRDILSFVKRNRIRLVGLNIPFHIPAKIRVGGLDNLLPQDRAKLPQNVDTSDQQHRQYVESIYQRHHFNGAGNFEYFYQAQCAWEDGMAKAIAQHLGNTPMIVLVGNGHIIHKFGIPQRAYSRTGANFRTIYPVTVGGQAELAFGDYLWVSPAVHEN